MAYYSCRVPVTMTKQTHEIYRNWCRDNCKKLQWTMGLDYIYFYNSEDAVVFKLKFGGK
jgi:hypothetical protein